MKEVVTMEQVEFVGQLILGLAIIVPLLIVLINATSRLTKSLTLLETTIKHLGEHLEKDEVILEQHSDKLHDHDLKILELQKSRD